MKIRLKAVHGEGTGIYGKDGKEYPVGHEMTVKEEPKGWAGRYDVISGKTEGKKAVTNPENPEGDGGNAGPQGPFEARDKENGWWGIFDANGTEVKALRKDDGEAFNSLSDEDKAAFVKSELEG